MKENHILPFLHLRTCIYVKLPKSIIQLNNLISFIPRPNVESTAIRLTRYEKPPVQVEAEKFIQKIFDKIVLRYIMNKINHIFIRV